MKTIWTAMVVLAVLAGCVSEPIHDQAAVATSSGSGSSGATASSSGAGASGSGGSVAGSGGSSSVTSSSGGAGGGADGGADSGAACHTVADCPASLLQGFQCSGIACDPTGKSTQPGWPTGCYSTPLPVGSPCSDGPCSGFCNATTTCIFTCPSSCTCVPPDGGT